MNDIDLNISKFDILVVGPSKSGPILEVDQDECPIYHSCTSEDGLSLKTDAVIGLNCSSQGVEIRGRGWKRLVQERHPSEAQIVPLQKKKKKKKEQTERLRKRTTSFPQKKCCVLSINQKPTMEAIGQPSREQ